MLFPTWMEPRQWRRWHSEVSPAFLKPQQGVFLSAGAVISACFSFPVHPSTTTAQAHVSLKDLVQKLDKKCLEFVSAIATLSRNSLFHHHGVKFLPAQRFNVEPFQLFPGGIVENGLWGLAGDFLEDSFVEFRLEVLEYECLHIREPVQSSSGAGLDDALLNVVLQIVELHAILTLRLVLLCPGGDQRDHHQGRGGRGGGW